MGANAERTLGSAYGPFAAYYDEFTAHHDYEAWTAVVERLGREHGLTGRTLLDVGCGTGKSLLPFARRGYRVSGCDLSPAMLRIARAKCRREALDVALWQADVRRLQPTGEGGFVTCLDDVLNYQLDNRALRAAVASLVSQLRRGGVLVFDANTERIYEESFLRARDGAGAAIRHSWRARRVGPGRYEARLEVEGPAGRVLSVHRQAHHSRAAIESALVAAGAREWAVYGMDFDGSVEPVADELRHTKFLYVVNR